MFLVFDWRWSSNAEERLLARAGQAPVLAPAATVTETGKELSAVVAPAPAALPVASESEGSTLSRAQSGDEWPATTNSRIEQAEWPGFRGRGRDGIVRGVRIDTDWSSSPPVELWRKPLGPGWSSFAVSGTLLYTQEQRGDDEIVAAYRVATGEPVWIHRDATRFFEPMAGAGPRATPTVSNGRVYTFGATGIVNALDARSGAVIWSRNASKDTGTPIPTWGFSSSPLVVDDLVLVAVSSQLAVYDASTGKARWTGSPGGEGYSSPQLFTIDGTPQVVLITDAGVRGFAPADGTRLWESLHAGFPIVQPAIASDGDLIVNSSDMSGGAGTRSIHVARGPGGWTVSDCWSSNGLKPFFNDFVLHKGHAFGFDGNILACISLEDGKRKWKGGRYGNGQLVLLPDQDLLFIVSEDGELALVSATIDQFKELARFPAFNAKTWNHPVLVGDRVFVRNGEEMAAFRLSLAGR